jgi:hypothetical protein
MLNTVNQEFTMTLIKSDKASLLNDVHKNELSCLTWSCI